MWRLWWCGGLARTRSYFFTCSIVWVVTLFDRYEDVDVFDNAEVGHFSWPDESHSLLWLVVFVFINVGECWAIIVSSTDKDDILITSSSSYRTIISSLWSVSVGLFVHEIFSLFSNYLLVPRHSSYDMKITLTFLRRVDNQDIPWFFVCVRLFKSLGLLVFLFWRIRLTYRIVMRSGIVFVSILYFHIIVMSFVIIVSETWVVIIVISSWLFTAVIIVISS